MKCQQGVISFLLMYKNILEIPQSEYITKIFLENLVVSIVADWKLHIANHAMYIQSYFSEKNYDGDINFQ